MIPPNKAEYVVDILTANPADEPIAMCDNFGDAMAKAEEYSNQYDEQFFVGVWLGENLVAIFDSIDWFTK